MTMSARPLIIAHRGASADAPENTLPAFRLAWEQGADAIEGDFHLTGDGEIVCIHNSATGSLAERDLIVSSSTVKELKQLDVGTWFGKQWAGTTIPTLAEVLETIPNGKRIFLEIKSGPDILPKLFETLQCSGLPYSRIVVISFHPGVIFQVKRQAPQIKALLLSKFTLDERTGGFRPSSDDVLMLLQRTQADGFSSKVHACVDELFVKKLLDAGYEYHVWIIDDVKTAEKFQRIGAISITTKRPGYLREHLLAET